MENRILIKKEHWSLNYLVTLFGTVQQLERETELVPRQNRVRTKSLDEIVKLKVDYTELNSKFFGFMKRPSVEWELSSEDSKLLRHLSAAAYYHITEKNNLTALEQDFVKIHEQNFKNW